LRSGELVVSLASWAEIRLRFDAWRFSCSWYGRARLPRGDEVGFSGTSVVLVGYSGEFGSLSNGDRSSKGLLVARTNDGVVDAESRILRTLTPRLKSRSGWCRDRQPLTTK
jgi:hypothetical protein